MSGRTARARLGAALALAVALPLGLSGCAVGDSLQHRTSGRAATPEALELAWRTPASQPDWVPADATGIRFVAATGGPADRSPASIRVRSGSPLPDSCTEVRRPSPAPFDERWAPATLPREVARCGNWAVVPVDGGWFGWTPLTPADIDG